jgi:hypothetical protein
VRNNQNLSRLQAAEAEFLLNIKKQGSDKIKPQDIRQDLKIEFSQELLQLGC